MNYLVLSLLSALADCHVNILISWFSLIAEQNQRGEKIGAFFPKMAISLGFQLPTELYWRFCSFTRLTLISIITVLACILARSLMIKARKRNAIAINRWWHLMKSLNHCLMRHAILKKGLALTNSMTSLQKWPIIRLLIICSNNENCGVRLPRDRFSPSW